MNTDYYTYEVAVTILPFRKENRLQKHMTLKPVLTNGGIDGFLQESALL